MRKFWLGTIFMVLTTVLVYKGIDAKTDLYGIMACIGAIAAGLGAVVYGNIKVHETQSTGSTVEDTSHAA
jgi:hypothetical protein